MEVRYNRVWFVPAAAPQTATPVVRPRDRPYHCERREGNKERDRSCLVDGNCCFDFVEDGETNCGEKALLRSLPFCRVGSRITKRGADKIYYGDAGGRAGL